MRRALGRAGGIGMTENGSRRRTRCARCEALIHELLLCGAFALGALGCSSSEDPPELDVRVVLSEKMVEVHAAEPAGCRHTLDFGELGTCRDEQQLAFEPRRCALQSTCLTEARLEHEGEVLARNDGDIWFQLELGNALPDGAELVLAGCDRETRQVLPLPLSDSEQVSEVVVTDGEFEPRWSHSDRVKTAFTFVFEPIGISDAFRAACHTPIDEARVPYQTQSLGYTLTSYALAEPVVASSPHGRLRLFPASRFEETLRP
jgi:hypothetical protein